MRHQITPGEIAVTLFILALFAAFCMYAITDLWNLSDEMMAEDAEIEALELEELRRDIA